MITALLNMEATPQTVSDLLTRAKGKWSECRVNLVLRAKVPGSKFYDRYVLPVIVDGDCKTALEHIQKLLRQSRITHEEAAQATSHAKSIAELTKR